MNLLTRYLSPLRVFKRLAELEAESAGATVQRRFETSQREKAVTDLRTDMLARFAPLARCARCGCIVDCSHPAVTVMRKGVNAPVASCLFCVSEMRRLGFTQVERASA